MIYTKNFINLLKNNVPASKIFAFTLAETLIVMGIIGVVAALTIPNLNQSTGNKEKVTKLKKIYSNLQDAHGRATANYGTVDTWFTKDGTDDNKITKRYAERLTDFLKTSKICGMTANGGCFSSSKIKFLKGSGEMNSPETATNEYKMILADGSSLSIRGIGSYFEIYYTVDIDGPNKGKNTIGNDIFSFYLGEDSSNELVTYDINDPTSCIGDDIGWTCSGWIIRNDNMDYLNADSSGKCKNNTSVVLNATVTSCK